MYCNSRSPMLCIVLDQPFCITQWLVVAHINVSQNRPCDNIIIEENKLFSLSGVCELPWKTVRQTLLRPSTSLVSLLSFSRSYTFLQERVILGWWKFTKKQIKFSSILNFKFKWNKHKSNVIHDECTQLAFSQCNNWMPEIQHTNQP